MNQRQIVYLTSHVPHLPYLVVSLMTVRRHWNGPVKVFAWPESIDLVREIAKDSRLAIETKESEPAYRARRDDRRQGKNDQFIHKIDLFPTIDAEVGLYLDADTSVHGDLSPLFQLAEEYGFVATRFSNWTTLGSVIQARVGRLRDKAGVDQDCVERVLSQQWPSANGGVFAARPSSPVFETWKRWTWEARFDFIADEAVLHALMPIFVPRRQMIVWPDGRFNCSCNPKWVPTGLEDRIVVWHYHGDANVRLQKHGGAGVRRWMPLFREALDGNWGNVRSWLPRKENDWLGNKHVKQLETVDGVKLGDFPT